MSKPILDQINLVCGDIDASLAFYRRLGIEIPDTMVWSTPTGVHHITAVNPAADQAGGLGLDLDSTAFAQRWNTGWKDRPDLKGRVVVGFHVPTSEEVDAIYRDMTGAGYRGLHEPQDMFWGARYAIIEDPDGIAVGVMGPISPDKKTPPPEV
jgi:catechol 2,3-dioxygenase-like lactoylglutathione lyase family enzyme